MNPYAHLTINNSVATVEFYSANHNALPAAVLKEISDHINNASADPFITIILLKSAGERSFCAGADFDELKEIQNETEGKLFFKGFANIILAMISSPKIIITRAQGKAVGGGVGLMAASDYCLAAAGASIRLSELSNGFGPFVIGPAIERKTGLAAFSHLTLNPTIWFDTAWSLQHGLINESHPNMEDLDIAVDQKINELQSYSSKALKELKKIFQGDVHTLEKLLNERAAISGSLLMSVEAQRMIQKNRIQAKKPE